MVKRLRSFIFGARNKSPNSKNNDNDTQEVNLVVELVDSASNASHTDGTQASATSVDRARTNSVDKKTNSTGNLLTTKSLASIAELEQHDGRCQKAISPTILSEAIPKASLIPDNNNLSNNCNATQESTNEARGNRINCGITNKSVRSRSFLSSDNVSLYRQSKRFWRRGSQSNETTIDITEDSGTIISGIASEVVESCDDISIGQTSRKLGNASKYGRFSLSNLSIRYSSIQRM